MPLFQLIFTTKPTFPFSYYLYLCISISNVGVILFIGARGVWGGWREGSVSHVSELSVFWQGGNKPGANSSCGNSCPCWETSACIKRASVFPSVCPCHSTAHCASSFSSSFSSAQRSRLITLSHEVYAFKIFPPRTPPPPHPPSPIDIFF